MRKRRRARRIHESYRAHRIARPTFSCTSPPGLGLLLRLRGLLLLLRLLQHLARADVLETLEVRPERSGAGEDELQLFGLEALGEDVLVVGAGGAEGVDQQLGALGFGVVAHLLDVGLGLAEDLGAL